MPSSSIEISVISLLLLRDINIFLLENLLALPIKFLNPYTISIDFVIFLNLSLDQIKKNSLLLVSLNEEIISLI